MVSDLGWMPVRSSRPKAFNVGWFVQSPWVIFALWSSLKLTRLSRQVFRIAECECVIAFASCHQLHAILRGKTRPWMKAFGLKQWWIAHYNLADSGRMVDVSRPFSIIMFHFLQLKAVILSFTLNNSCVQLQILIRHLTVFTLYSG